MIHYYTGHPAEVYRQQFNDLLLAPEVTLRGLRTRELLHVVTEIPNPRDRLGIVPGRRLNPWLALSEALWLLAGRNDLTALAPYNKRIAEFSDDGKMLYGAYGYRIAGQIEPALARLRMDSADRRAVLAIWRAEDLTAPTLDPPCNDTVMFKLRDGALHMSVFCRSNDLHWGLHAVNIVQFGILQEYLAARLGVAFGPQLHWSDSLHIYRDGPAAEISERMVARSLEPVVALKGAPLWADLDEWKVSPVEFVKDCSDVLDDLKYGGLAFMEFADDFLRCYRERRYGQLESCRHAKTFTDWVTLGNEFWKEKEHAD